MPHSGNTWTKTTNHTQVLGTGLTDIDVQDIERLREENDSLKTAMKEVRTLAMLRPFRSRNDDEKRTELLSHLYLVKPDTSCKYRYI